MLFVLKKENIMPFTVTCFTVFVLFLMTAFLNKKPSSSVVKTSANIESSNSDSRNQTNKN